MYSDKLAASLVLQEAEEKNSGRPENTRINSEFLIRTVSGTAGHNRRLGRRPEAGSPAKEKDTSLKLQPPEPARGTLMKVLLNRQVEQLGTAYSRRETALIRANGDIRSPTKGVTPRADIARLERFLPEQGSSARPSLITHEGRSKRESNSKLRAWSSDEETPTGKKSKPRELHAPSSGGGGGGGGGGGNVGGPGPLGGLTSNRGGGAMNALEGGSEALRRAIMSPRRERERAERVKNMDDDRSDDERGSDGGWRRVVNNDFISDDDEDTQRERRIERRGLYSSPDSRRGSMLSSALVQATRRASKEGSLALRVVKRKRESEGSAGGAGGANSGGDSSPTRRRKRQGATAPRATMQQRRSEEKKRARKASPRKEGAKTLKRRVSKTPSLNVDSGDEVLSVQDSESEKRQRRG